jgi:AcrR family transcriptional regulator
MEQGIAATAERLFADVGFQKTTVSDIASKMCMSPANVYRFFSSKAEINNEVGRRLLSEIEVAVDHIIENSSSASEKLRATIATVEKMNARRFLSNQRLHELLETAFEENWPIVKDHIQKLDESLAEIISYGNDEKEFDVEDYELAAILVRSACLRFYDPRVIIDCADEPEPTVDQMVDFCLGALR